MVEVPVRDTQTHRQTNSAENNGKHTEHRHTDTLTAILSNEVTTI